MRRLTFALLAFGVAADSSAEPGPSGPTERQVLAAFGVDIHGYADAAYSWLSGDGVFTSGVADRVFDTEPNSFSLHQAALTVATQPKEGLGAVANLTAGRNAGVIKSFDTTTNDFDVTQAFVQYVHGPMTVIGGKFVTLAGAEVIDSTSNVNYSRSILFGYAIPFSHTGVRVMWAVNDTLILIAGANNGWDQLKDANRQKTIELGFAYVPVQSFSLLAQGYSGREQVGGFTDTTSGRRNVIDLVATVTASDQLAFILNYDYGSQDNATSLVDGGTIKAKWSGLAGYVNYRVNDQWRISLRAEYFDDKDGYRTGVIQEWKEATLTLAYLPNASMELRAEVRGDRSDQRSFVDSNGATAKKDQSSIGLEAIYKF